MLRKDSNMQNTDSSDTEIKFLIKIINRAKGKTKG